MPHEIADSDEEVEVVPSLSKSSQSIGQKEGAPPSTADRQEQGQEQEQDPVLHLDFDTFLSPTQRISSYDGNHDTSHESISSTDRFLNEVEPALAESHINADGGEGMMGGKSGKSQKTSKKRSRTQHDDGTSPRDNASAQKRTKSNTMSSSQIDFAALTASAEMVSVEERTQYTEPLDLSLAGSISNDDIANGHAVQSYTPHTTFFGANLQGGTTSRSSMGNYQSFTIDPNALNLDYNKINPFGSLTQASFDGDIDTEETRALAGIFTRPASDRADTEVLMNLQEMQTVDAPEQLIAQEEPPQGSPSFSPITNPDDNNSNLEPVVPEQALDEHVHTVEEPSKPAPKKRGRKPKQKKPDDPIVNDQNDLGELHTDDHHGRRTIRAGTVDSVSNVSEVSQATTSSKTGRKQKTKKSDMAPPEVLSKKLPSSDLGLDKKEVIGLSPERYVPRPSRRRGRAEPEPTSDFASAEPDEPTLQSPTPELPDKAVPASGKKGKKSKVKRAKTHAAHVLGKSADLLDDDEKEEAKEVIFLDEQPAKVKFQPLPELSPDRKLKTEGLVKKLDEAEADEDEEETGKSGKRTTRITIDVPALPKSDDHEELPPPVPEPKKRGRKRKKPVEVPVEELPAEETQEEERPALVEKDKNAPGRKTKVQNTEFVEDEKEEVNKENSRTKGQEEASEKVSTPEKSPSTPAPKPAHSPLKRSASTTPLFNARTRIGLSKRHSIPSLLRKVDRNREPPKAIERKEKLNKRQLEEKEQERIAREEAEAEGREYVPSDLMRGKDGLLVEWDF
ncbi:hypothetical protein LTR70_010114 [Exophiala xenobiotica]|uniref:Uncharacterized protein n=1 Tax=Lithohypha guttulata TaxID=1690604 RepID=A0ABR0JV29_9EURO|nr:hypothetical protein LTR24_010058 [Lithohypha guttulata]KAK5309647.1 hypothetical protein LTR70_010114 [Exophiala xenobiotica]